MWPHAGQIAYEYFIIGTAGDPTLQDDISLFIDPVLGTTTIASHNVETGTPAGMAGGLGFVAMNNTGTVLTSNYGLWQNGSILATLRSPVVAGEVLTNLMVTELNASGQTVGWVELYNSATQVLTFVPVIWDALGNATIISVNFTVDVPDPDPTGSASTLFVNPVGINDSGQILATINPSGGPPLLAILNPPPS